MKITTVVLEEPHPSHNNESVLLKNVRWKLNSYSVHPKDTKPVNLSLMCVYYLQVIIKHL